MTVKLAKPFHLSASIFLCSMLPERLANSSQPKHVPFSAEESAPISQLFKSYFVYRTKKSRELKGLDCLLRDTVEERT